MSIAGIDIGTTGCKCSVYSRSGDFIKEAYQEYDIIRNSGQHELDLELVWEAVQAVVKEACEGSSEVQAIGITSFGEVFVMVDKAGRPLTKAMLYTDFRGDEECRQLAEQFGGKQYAKITGVRLHKMMSVSRIMWMKKRFPKLYEEAEYIFLMADYFNYLFCGNALIDYSLAARTAMFDIQKLDWDEGILKFTGVDREKLPRPVPTGTKAGKIRPELATALGLSKAADMVIGCHDQIAAAIGSGILSPGLAADGAGTVECITPLFQMPVSKAVLYEGGYAVIPYVIADTYVTYGFSFTGGALLKWYRDQLCSMEYKEALQPNESIYDRLNREVKDEPGRLLILPHFSGAGTPYMDDGAKGAIIGLTTETTSIEIYQALMEAVAFEMKINLEQLTKAGIQINHLQASGGGAKSALWLQMKADILNIPITSLATAQAGTMGCIMLAGVACGFYTDIHHAKEVFVKQEKTYYPREEFHQKYAIKYGKYKRMYAAVNEVLRD